ncbi:MAG: hypothetical protein CVV03_12020 [Firmicutes bacterium HGW-Firmicutes-8]|nr:MAG: hypothetical protein CVV03_12020 [Firmicutes bacterium HGW-Firmicutes-8]
MTYGEDGKYDAAYTYGLERIEVEDIDETRPESQDPLYYLYDGLGSVTYMVKPDGNMRDHYRYDEYGKPAPGNSKLSEDGRINLNNTFGYTGEMWDEESNLLYLRARYYEPETGRFLSRDSYEGELENPLSKHLYAYVRNPVNHIDPTGHWGANIHHDKTLELAKEVGFNDDEAEIIAKYDQGIDTSAHGLTTGMTGIAGQSWHENTITINKWDDYNYNNLNYTQDDKWNLNWDIYDKVYGRIYSTPNADQALRYFCHMCYFVVKKIL